MKKPKEQKKGQPDWLATYSDLVTNLMIFFVLLFSMSSVDSEKFKALSDSFGAQSSILTGEGGILGDAGVGMLPVDIDKHPDASTPEEPEHEFSPQGEELVEVGAAAAKAAEEANKRMELLGTMASEFKTYFAQNDAIASGTSTNTGNGESSSDGIDVEIDESGQFIKVIFGDGVLFDSGRADLKPGAIQAIDLAADILINYANHIIRVEGHTDNVPMNTSQYPSNRYLSAARAIAVLEYLENQRGFEPKSITAEGMGEYWPRVPNDNAENRAANRRVEIKVYAQLQSDDAVIPIH